MTTSASTLRTIRLHQLSFELTAADDDGKAFSFVNPRSESGLSDEEIAELAADIAANGLQVLPKVQRVVVEGPHNQGFEGTFDLVIDGQRRIRALKYLYTAGKLSSDEITVDDAGEPIPFTAHSAATLLANALTIGTKRKGLSSYELAKAGAALRASGKSNAEIGKVLDRSTTWVSRMLGALSKATPELIETWRQTDGNGQSKIPDDSFKDLAALSKLDQPKALQEFLSGRDGGTREAKAEARAAVKVQVPPSPAKTAKATQYEWAPEEDRKLAKADKSEVAPDSLGAGKSVPKASAKKTEVKDAVKFPRPSAARLAEFSGQRGDRGARDPYIRGLLDMAAFALGEVDESSFAPSYRTWLKAVAKTATKVAAPAKTKAAKTKPAKGSALAARAKKRRK